MEIRSSTIYLVDNGAAYCGDHLGSTARATGRDISGQPILPITPEVASLSLIQYGPYACELCGREAELDPR